MAGISRLDKQSELKSICLTHDLGQLEFNKESVFWPIKQKYQLHRAKAKISLCFQDCSNQTHELVNMQKALLKKHSPEKFSV